MYELQIAGPWRGVVAFGEITARQKTPFVPTRLAQLLALEIVPEYAAVLVYRDVD